MKNKPKKKKMRGKCTKLKGLPPTQQPRDILPEVVKEGLPIVTWHKEVPRLLVREGQRQIDDEPRPSIPGHELIVTKLLGLL